MTTETDDVNCANCSKGVDIRDRDKLVCLAHLDFREPQGGVDCEHFTRRRRKAAPPIADATTTERT